jgi:hypothetical protein
MRAEESNEEHSYMKLILFVCMVVVAVLLLGPSKPQVDLPATSSRALMEIS